MDCSPPLLRPEGGLSTQHKLASRQSTWEGERMCGLNGQCHQRSLIRDTETPIGTHLKEETWVLSWLMEESGFWWVRARGRVSGNQDSWDLSWLWEGSVVWKWGGVWSQDSWVLLSIPFRVAPWLTACLHGVTAPHMPHAVAGDMQQQPLTLIQ